MIAPNSRARKGVKERWEVGIFSNLNPNFLLQVQGEDYPPHPEEPLPEGRVPRKDQRDHLLPALLAARAAQAGAHRTGEMGQAGEDWFW